MRITLFQYDIAWEDPATNLATIGEKIWQLTGLTDLLVIPEMALTGFSMNTVSALTMNSQEINQLQQLADESHIAIVGSFMILEEDNHYNRAIFFAPQSPPICYDKKHLFRMGIEHQHYSAGNEQVIVSYLGWNICLQICYDLRFPVWARNQQNSYDILIYMANWPQPRASVWHLLTRARAIENTAYVCAVNRIGNDANGLYYEGGTMMIDYLGNIVGETAPNTTFCQTYTVEKEAQDQFRHKFPVHLDADQFKLVF